MINLYINLVNIFDNFLDLLMGVFRFLNALQIEYLLFLPVQFVLIFNCRFLFFIHFGFMQYIIHKLEFQGQWNKKELQKIIQLLEKIKFINEYPFRLPFLQLMVL